MYNPSEEEQKILKFWEENNIFEKSLEKTKKGKPFVFYDGPPFATGTPHYGHLLQSAIKDVIPRYKTMQGFYVERQWGWDCHGLPIENIVEKELGKTLPTGQAGKKEIMAMGVKKFNDLCREKIFTFVRDWEKIIPRFGRWADMKNAYKTMDFEYMQSEWWAFKELYKKGLIYEDYRAMHICPRCETTLSQGEVTEGYKTIKDLSVTVEFRIKGEPKTSFLAWTTTPWTLPGNVVLAVGPEMTYVKIEKKDMGTGDVVRFILAKSRLETIFGGQEYTIVEEYKGEDLVGIEYEPLFDYYASDKNLKNKEHGWKVYPADFITEEDGTGIAHEAPAFGADDWVLLKKYNLPFVQHISMDGIFKPEVKDFAGQSLLPRAKDKPEEIREADLSVVKFLEGKGLVFDYKKYEHAYPHCWRCDTALLNYATSSWFVAVEKIKPALLKTAKKINWSPEHIKEGRFGQWLAGARDWSISRQRFWANTIPVWRCDKCGQQEVFGSAAELEDVSGKKITDLHKEIVDEVTFNCECLGRFRRVPDVLDTWFDSGSVPFATGRTIPADFIGEAQDQTRAWFYYQHVLVGALLNKQAFKNCVVTGIVLSEDGKKMSKKLQNYPDPSVVIEKYGADAMRYYMLSSPVVRAENLSFSEKGVNEILQKNISRLYNVVSFYKLSFFKTDDDGKVSNRGKHILDTWILARLKELIALSTQGYENYNVDEAVRPISDFIDDLSVWYLRRSRDRFKDFRHKIEALTTLRWVLYQTSLVIAPSMPFFAEYLFGKVSGENSEESVHLQRWPKQEKLSKAEIDIINKMKIVRDIASLALAQRMEKAIKVKQPLAKLKVKSSKVYKELGKEFLDLIKDEVNVKEIIFDNTMQEQVELDINITPELKREGILREVVRAYNEARKMGNYVPETPVKILVSPSIGKLLSDFDEQQLGSLKIIDIEQISDIKEIPENYVTQEVTIHGQQNWLAIPKAQ